MKKVAGERRSVEKKVVAVRRSARVANNPAPVYVEVASTRFSSPRNDYGVARGREWNGVFATPEARAKTIEKAEELVTKLEEEGHPTLIRPLLPSHVSGCFWLGLPSNFCKAHLPHSDTTVTLMNEEGDEYPTVYLPRKNGLSGGWIGFAKAHGLSDGDAIVFQLISHSVLKVYIVRVNGQESSED